MVGHHYNDKPLRASAVNDLLEKALNRRMTLVINRIQPLTLVRSQAEVIYEECSPVPEYLRCLPLIAART